MPVSEIKPQYDSLNNLNTDKFSNDDYGNPRTRLILA